MADETKVKDEDEFAEKYRTNPYAHLPANTNTSASKPARREPRVDPVVKGSPGRRMEKKSGVFQDIAKYVKDEVLIPTAMDVISNIITNSVEIICDSIAPNAKRRGRRSKSYASYYRRSEDRDRRRDRDDDRPVSRRRRIDDWEDIFLPKYDDNGERTKWNASEADGVLIKMMDLANDYGEATVADLYDACGITAEHTDEKWGWRKGEFHGKVLYRSDGYIIRTDSPEPLK